MKQKKKSLVYIRTYGRDMITGKKYDVCINNMEITRQRMVKTMEEILEFPSEDDDEINGFLQYKEDLRGINELLEIPFDVLIVVDDEYIQK